MWWIRRRKGLSLKTGGPLLPLLALGLIIWSPLNLSADGGGGGSSGGDESGMRGDTTYFKNDCGENCPNSYDINAGRLGGLQQANSYEQQKASGGNTNPVAKPQGQSQSSLGSVQVRTALMAHNAGREAALLGVLQTAEGLVAIAHSPPRSPSPGILVRQGIDGLRASDALRDQGERAQKRAQELGSKTNSLSAYTSDLSLLKSGAGGAIMAELEQLYGVSREDFAKKLLTGARGEQGVSAALGGAVPAGTIANVLKAGDQAPAGKKEEVRRGARTAKLSKNLLEKLTAFSEEVPLEGRLAANALLAESEGASGGFQSAGFGAPSRSIASGAPTERGFDPTKLASSDLGGPKFSGGGLGGAASDFFGKELTESINAPPTVYLEGVSANGEISIFQLVKRKIGEWQRRNKGP